MDFARECGEISKAFNVVDIKLIALAYFLQLVYGNKE